MKQEKTSLSFERVLPHISIDCAIFGFHENQLRVLLLRWKNLELWSLPGGRVLRNESVEAAVYRTLEERTGLQEVFLQQFHTFGDTDRLKNTNFRAILEQLGFDSEMSNVMSDRTVTVGYYALVEYSKVTPTPDFYTDECRWWDVRELPELIFDHKEIAVAALQTLRRQLNYQPIGLNLLPDKFTMPELQKLYETILGKELDRRNFHKRILSYDILERLEERRSGGAHKSPYLYRFDLQKYQKALAEGWKGDW
ncbi:MAG: NUDIX domain-containing protein [Saprospiraceae bacterium]|nr:NUDIX domain-containing protein [Saprospiraceae bacterium]